MITVIIPALNEVNTIRQVIQTCFSAPQVSEVIVVDDGSQDGTAQAALDAGAIVLLSKKRGKGFSMKEGVMASRNELIVFLDADIDPYPPYTIEKLTAPLLEGNADFVKGNFTRNAGRVTLLVAKPLLSIFYPGLSTFSQPLSGMVAGRRSLFLRMDFFNDYGVDVGILIDMYLMKARIREVTIGHIENKSKPWEALGRMSLEVSRAIITRAQRHDPAFAEDEIETISAIQEQMSRTLTDKLASYGKMIVFDMDNTILEGRFIDHCAEAFGFKDALAQLRAAEKDPIILTKRIGLLLKGRSMDELLAVAESIPLIPDIHEVVTAFKKNGFVVGIISNSYMLVTNYVKHSIHADFCMANKLEYFEGVATGEVILPSYFFAPPNPSCGHAYCKTHALSAAAEKYNVRLENCISVGDSMDDLCMIRSSGKGYAFRPTDRLADEVSDTIMERSFRSLMHQL